MKLVGVDIGTTHCKAGLVAADGSATLIARRPSPLSHDSDGRPFYDPEELWQTACAVIREVATGDRSGEIAGVGITSMAETGLLIDRRTGVARSPVIPWFDTRASAQADRIKRESDPFERFCRTGQYPSFKSPLAKMLWLRDQDRSITSGALWLSAADYIAYRLTGTPATDYSLATRTYAFRIDQKAWDESWLQEWGLPDDLFPQALPAGTPIGAVRAEVAERLGLTHGTSVAIAGHDHVCAAFAVGTTEPGHVFDSMGTAETLVGALAEQPLGRREYESGLGYGCHVARNRLYWMGGLSTAGGSIEWLRGVLGAPPLSYEELESLLGTLDGEPTRILYFPYLLGSGSPHSDSTAQGAFIGLRMTHSRAHLVKAVLEGTALELEFIRRAAQAAINTPIDTVIAAGGGTRNRLWLQIKADVSGCRLLVPPIDEATVLGAAIRAGVGAGIYRDAPDAVSRLRGAAAAEFWPNPARHERYRQLYEQGYLPLQQPLRAFAHLGDSSATPRVTARGDHGRDTPA